jgi:hypothetical protein
MGTFTAGVLELFFIGGNSGGRLGMSRSEISLFPSEPFGEGVVADLSAAFRYLRDEMVLVRDGKTANLVVLDDEIANAETVLVSL